MIAVEGGAREISFSSDGGDLGSALRGFDALWRAGITTRATGPCASACVLLFAAGRQRLVDPGGAIGVHRWQSAGADQAGEVEAQILTAEILERFLQAGISADLHVAASRVPAEEMRFLSERDLAAWGVVTLAPAGQGASSGLAPAGRITSTTSRESGIGPGATPRLQCPLPAGRWCSCRRASPMPGV